MKKPVENQSPTNDADAQARHDRLVTRALMALDALADGFGDNRARHAAALLRDARPAGRKPIDDSAALVEVERLVAAGKPRAAVAIVAAKLALAEGIARDSVARRLRRRLLNKNGQ